MFPVKKYKSVLLFGLCYFILIILFSKILNFIFPKYDKNKSRIIIFIEILLQLCINFVFVYIIENYLPILLEPLNIDFKSPHITTAGTVVIGSMLFNTQSHLLQKIKYVFNMSN